MDKFDLFIAILLILLLIHDFIILGSYISIAYLLSNIINAIYLKIKKNNKKI
jgi:hypothetical protein